MAQDWPKMRALGGVAEQTKPAIAVPLYQCKPTGNLLFQVADKNHPAKFDFHS